MLREETDANEPLASSEQELRQIVETIPTLVWRARPDGDIDYVNKRVLEYLGAPFDEVVGWSWMDKVHPDDVAFRERTWLNKLDLEGSREAACRFRGADGRYRWFTIRGAPVPGSDGRPLRWYGVLVDIDDRRKAEEALQESEYKLREIVETVPGFVWSTAPDGQPTQLNRRVLEYSGMSFEDFLNLGWAKFVHPDDFPETKNALYAAIQTGTSYQAVHRLRRADGEYRWYHARGEPLRDEQGRIIQWYGISVDIDERKKAEEQLQSTQARLARASQIATVAQLSASIAHEVNQPLAAIVANAQNCLTWLSEESPNIARAKVAADRIVRDGAAAAEVVRRIRALFKQAAPEKSPLQINEVIDEVRRLLQAEMTRRDIAVEWELTEGLPRTSADRIQIQQALVNLIRNGAEAMEETDDPRLLTIRSRSEDGRIVVEISDTGRGLPDQAKAFEPFFSTKPDGMGVGLTISRSIILAHAGELWASKNVPRGTTWTFALPAS